MTTMIYIFTQNFVKTAVNSQVLAPSIKTYGQTNAVLFNHSSAYSLLDFPKKLHST